MIKRRVFKLIKIKKIKKYKKKITKLLFRFKHIKYINKKKIKKKSILLLKNQTLFYNKKKQNKNKKNKTKKHALFFLLYIFILFFFKKQKAKAWSMIAILLKKVKKQNKWKKFKLKNILNKKSNFLLTPTKFIKNYNLQKKNLKALKLVYRKKKKLLKKLKTKKKIILKKPKIKKSYFPYYYFKKNSAHIFSKIKNKNNKTLKKIKIVTIMQFKKIKQKPITKHFLKYSKKCIYTKNRLKNNKGNKMTKQKTFKFFKKINYLILKFKFKQQKSLKFLFFFKKIKKKQLKKKGFTNIIKKKWNLYLRNKTKLNYINMIKKWKTKWFFLKKVKQYYYLKKWIYKKHILKKKLKQLAVNKTKKYLILKKLKLKKINNKIIQFIKIKNMHKYIKTKQTKIKLSALFIKLNNLLYKAYWKKNKKKYYKSVLNVLAIIKIIFKLNTPKLKQLYIKQNTLKLAQKPNTNFFYFLKFMQFVKIKKLLYLVGQLKNPNTIKSLKNILYINIQKYQSKYPNNVLAYQNLQKLQNINIRQFHTEQKKIKKWLLKSFFLNKTKQKKLKIIKYKMPIVKKKYKFIKRQKTKLKKNKHTQNAFKLKNRKLLKKLKKLLRRKKWKKYKIKKKIKKKVYKKFLVQNWKKKKFMKFNIKYMKGIFNIKKIHRKIKTKILFFTPIKTINTIRKKMILKKNKKSFLFFKIKKQNLNQIKYKNFLFQRRTQKEGINKWQKFTKRWFYYNLLQNKTIKFYYTPLQIKKRTKTKKLKFLQIFWKLNTKHPKPGKWTTFGLIGNRTARNTNFIKFKILNKIFSQFYGFKLNKKTTQLIKKKFKKYSKTYSNIQQVYSFFENRFDIVCFRAQFLPNIALIRLLIKHGYFEINFITKTKPNLQIAMTSFISIIVYFRKIFKNFFINSFFVFRNVYQTKFFKVPIFYNLSNYIKTLLVALTQFQENKNWIEKLTPIYKTLDSYNKIQFFHERNKNITPISKIKNNLTLNTTLNLIFKKKFNFFLKKEFFKSEQKIKIFKQKTLKKIIENKIIFTNKKQIKAKTHFKIFKQILKDILLQTWEHFTENIIINKKFLFCITFTRISFINFALNKTNKHINTTQFKWFIKTV